MPSTQAFRQCELELQPNRFAIAAILVAGSILCAWATFAVIDQSLWVGLTLTALTIGLPVFAIGFVRNRRFFVAGDVIGINNILGHARTVPRSEVTTFAINVSNVPSLVFYRSDGTEALRLRPAVLTSRQGSLLGETLRLPQAQPRPHRQLEIERTADGLVLRPSEARAWTAMTTWTVVAAVVIAGSGILLRRLKVEIALPIAVAWLLAELALSRFYRTVQIFANSQVMGKRGIFGGLHSLPRDEFRSIESSEFGRASYWDFYRIDGRKVFTVGASWWTEEQIGALRDYLQAPSVTGPDSG